MSLERNRNQSRFVYNQRINLGFLLIFCLIFDVVKSYPSGAPTFTCESMMPEHGNATAQNGPSPFVTTPEQVIKKSYFVSFTKNHIVYSNYSVGNSF